MPAETRVFQTRPRSSPVCTRRVSKTGVHPHASAAISLELQLFRSARPTVPRRDTTAVQFVCYAYRPSPPVHLSPQPVLIAGAAPRPHRSIQPPHPAESPQKPFDHCCRQAIRYAIVLLLRSPGSLVTRLMLQPFQRHQRAALGWSLSPYAHSMHCTEPTVGFPYGYRERFFRDSVVFQHPRLISPTEFTLRICGQFTRKCIQKWCNVWPKKALPGLQQA
jgi:hypothetical protein